MAHAQARAIRNVALVGHRGSGKTSLNEALLFQAGATNRLGSVDDGTTVSDSAPDERARSMSIAASLGSFEWSGCKVNLIDTPGEPSFVSDALCALRVCESAVFVVNAVMGVEVGTQRLWDRSDELGLSRLLFVNMLDRERADFFRALDSLKQAFGPHVVATEIPIGTEHEVRGVIDLIDMRAYAYEGTERTNCEEIDIPAELRPHAEEHREKLMDEVAEVSDELMERYLEGEEISHEETVEALEAGVAAGRIFPVTCGVATRNLAINRLLDAFCEDLPSPRGGRARLQDARRPLRRAHQPLPRLPGRRQARLPRAQHARAREGADRPAARAAGQGDGPRGGVRPRRPGRGREAQGDPRGRRARRERHGDRAATARPALACDGVRDRAEGARRRGQGLHGAATAA
jgi:translation elongation factor EF-G